MKKILITGSNGFLGKNFVPRFREMNKDSLLFTPSSKELDLRDRNAIDCYITKNNISEVIHFAVQMKGIGKLMSDPLLYFENNIDINTNLVKSSRMNGVQRFVTLGTSCLYSNETPLPMKEETIWSFKPENTVGIAKLVMLEHLKCQNEMQWLYLIPSNFYGPHDHFGKIDAHFIPALLYKLEKAGSDPVSVWGDGYQIRDFLYVEDAVDIICRAYNNSHYWGKPVNISTGEGTSIRKVVDCIVEYLNLGDILIKYDSKKQVGIYEKVLSNELMNELDGKYTFTKFEDGIKATLDWYIKNKTNL